MSCMSQNFRLFHVGIEFIRSKLSIFSAHVYGVTDTVRIKALPRPRVYRRGDH